VLLAGSLLSGIPERQDINKNIKSICEAHRPLVKEFFSQLGTNIGPFYFHTRAWVMGMKKGDAHQT